MQVRPCSHCCCDPRGISERGVSGAILAPPHRKRGASFDQGLHIWVQVTRHHRWVRVARHTLDYVQRHAAVRHPSQGCVPQAVTHQTRQPETSEDFIPRGDLSLPWSPTRRVPDTSAAETWIMPMARSTSPTVSPDTSLLRIAVVATESPCCPSTHHGPQRPRRQQGGQGVATSGKAKSRRLATSAAPLERPTILRLARFLAGFLASKSSPPSTLRTPSHRQQSRSPACPG